MKKAVTVRYDTNKDLPKIVEALVDLGAEYLRTDVLTTSGKYYDLMTAIRDAGLKAILIPSIDFPDWNRIVGFCCGLDPAFVQNWNEPDSSTFQRPNMEGKMNQAYGICKDRGVKVIVNSKWRPDFEYLDSAYSHFCDEVAIDIYPEKQPTQDENGNKQDPWHRLRTDIRRARTYQKITHIMEANMFMASWTEPLQAERIKEIMQVCYEENIEIFSYFSLYDRPDWTGASDWGLLREDGSRKLVYDAFRNWEAKTPPSTIGFATVFRR